MSIKVKCQCGAVSKGRDDMAGLTVPCPRCKAPLVFPNAPVPSLGITIAPADDPTTLTDEEEESNEEEEDQPPSADDPTTFRPNPVVTAGQRVLHSTAQAVRNRIAAQRNQPEPTRVIVVDFNMPLASMVGFMVKWAIAAIPAMFILFGVFACFWIIAGAIIMNAFR